METFILSIPNYRLQDTDRTQCALSVNTELGFIFDFTILCRARAQPSSSSNISYFKTKNADKLKLVWQ